MYVVSLKCRGIRFRENISKDILVLHYVINIIFIRFLIFIRKI